MIKFTDKFQETEETKFFSKLAFGKSFLNYFFKIESISNILDKLVTFSMLNNFLSTINLKS